MTIFTNQIQETSKIKSWLNRPVHLSLIIGLACSGIFSTVWSQLTVFSAVTAWPLGFSVGFLLTSWLYLRRQRTIAWGLAIAGQFFGVIGIGLLVIASLKI